MAGIDRTGRAEFVKSLRFDVIFCRPKPTTL
jgi:hypothetical protein